MILNDDSLWVNRYVLQRFGITPCGHTDYITCIAVASDNQFMVTASRDLTIRMWDIGKRLQVPRFIMNCNCTLREILLSFNNLYLVYATFDKKVVVTNVLSKHVMVLTGHRGPVWAIALPRNNKFVISAGSSTEIIVWELRYGGGNFRLEGHTAAVNGLAYADDAGKVISASEDKTLRVWDFASKEVIQVVQLGMDFIITLAVTSECARIAYAGENNKISVLDTNSSSISILSGHSSFVTILKITPDDQFLVSASKDKSIKIWNILSQNLFFSFEGHTSTISSIAITYDCTRVISSGLDRTLKIFNLKLTREERGFNSHTDYVTSISESKNKKYIATGGLDKTIRIWTVSDKQNISTLIGHTGEVKMIGDNFTSEIVSVSVNNELLIWDVLNEKVFKKFEMDTKSVCKLGMNKENVVICMNDGMIFCFNIREACFEKVIKGGGLLQALYVSSEFKRFFICGSKEIQVWSGEIFGKMNRFIIDFDSKTMAESGNGKYLVICNQKTIVLRLDKGQVRKNTDSIYGN